jgi:hypothetical protein
MARTKIAPMDAGGAGKASMLRASLKEPSKGVLRDGVPIDRIDASAASDRESVQDFPIKEFCGSAKEMATRLVIRVINAPAIIVPAEPHGMNWTVKMGLAAIMRRMRDIRSMAVNHLQTSSVFYAPPATV